MEITDSVPPERTPEMELKDEFEAMKRVAAQRRKDRDDKQKRKDEEAAK